MANPASLNVNTLSAHSAVARPVAQTIDTNGTVSVPGGQTMDRLLIELDNAAANAIDVTIKAGANPPSLAARDLVVTVPATGNRVLGPLESGRFTKADGTFDIQFQASAGSPNLAIRIYRLPKQI
jgi:hypothetical protein